MPPRNVTPPPEPTYVPVASLILDETFYPRHNVSRANVATIAEAMRAGVEMPPILVANKTGSRLRKRNTVVDGWHRIHAAIALGGDEAIILVQFKDYANEQEMLADALSYNVGRGLDLTRWDQTRCIQLAETVGMSLDRLASLLQWEPTRLEKYQQSRMGKTVDDRKIALKRSLRSRTKPGAKPVTPEQERANEDGLDGMADLYHIRQLIMRLEIDSIPQEAHIAQALITLSELIFAWSERYGNDQAV